MRRTAIWSVSLIVALLAVVLAMLVAGCGGSDDGAEEPAAASQQVERQERETTEQPAQQDAGDQDAQQDQEQQQPVERSAQSTSAAPRDSATLRIARSEPINLDPAQVTDVSSAVIIVEIFGGLLTLDQDLRIAPDLAEAVPGPTTNADGTVTYRFTLRRDAKFHDGKRISAGDVKWSFERHAAPETLSPTAPDFLGDIIGVREYTRGRADEIVGIQVIDDVTLDITIDSAKPYFLYLMTFPVAFVVDRAQVEADPERWSLRPNGTGPFQAP